MKILIGTVLDTRAGVLQIAYQRSGGHADGAVRQRIISFRRRPASTDSAARRARAHGPVRHAVEAGES